MPRKARPSLKNAEFVADNVKKMSIEQIAEQTKLSKETVRKIAEVYGNTPQKNIYWKDYLHRHIVWKQLKREFSSDELEIFEEQFCSLVSQFKEDMTPTEETQMFQLLKMSILMSRSLISQHKMRENMELLETAMKGVVDKYNGDFTDLQKEDRDFITDIERQLSGIRQLEQSSTSEYAQLQTQYNKILELLKGARNQRKDIIENSKVSFVDLVKALQDKDRAEAEGRQLELFKIATNGEITKLSKPHKYMDGSIDLPILDADTIDAFDKPDISDTLQETGEAEHDQSA